MTLAWHTSILAYQTCDNEGQTGMLFADLDWTGVVKKYPECWEKTLGTFAETAEKKIPAYRSDGWPGARNAGCKLSCTALSRRHLFINKKTPLRASRVIPVVVSKRLLRIIPIAQFGGDG